MVQYIIRRLLTLIPTLLGVTIVVFLFLRLIPGDPAVAMLGEHATPESVARIREQFGLNRPLFLDAEGLREGDLNRFFDSQYVRFLGRLVRGDLGESILSRVPIVQDLKTKFPATMELSVFAMLVALAVGIPAGILSAARRNSIWDGTSMLLSLVGVSMPIFWLGIMEIMIFAVLLHWLPFGGRLDTGMSVPAVTNLMLIDTLVAGDMTAFWSAVKHLIMPGFALATIPMAIIARMTRSSMLEVLQQDYIRTAHSKGLQERVILIRHALRNALLPVVTVVGLQIGLLLSGAIMTETIFAWPGLGRWIYDSILGRDYPIVQGGTLLIAVIFVFLNLLVDVSYAFLDPRIHYD